MAVPTRARRRAAAFLPALLQASAAFAAAGDGPSFVVRFTPEARAESFSGRVLVFLSKTDPEPRAWSNPARLDPVLGTDFAQVAPGEAMVLGGEGTLAFPVAPGELEGGRYWAQAVLDADPSHPRPGTAPGNPRSRPVEIELSRGESARFELLCDRADPVPELRQTRWSRLVEVPSKRLARFHGRPVVLRALVHLPEAWYAEPERRFPLHFFLSGFGASIEGFDFVDWPAPPLEGVPFRMVYPDPSCASGHSGFADSDNNGPYGTAFVRELVPAIERELRGLGEPEARLLVGHSSGGWSALWLMASYPGEFGYAWAKAPDPVDFRDFMGVDLYARGANLFRDPEGRLRPFCRIGNVWTVGFNEEHSARERVLRGGVLGSFEALYGPRSAGGAPARLWERESGAIDPEVAASWSRYDLGRLLRERWEELAPYLDGRIAITIGDRDNFLLQGSALLLRRDLEALGAKARIRLLAGDHFSVSSPDPDAAELRAMVDSYRAWAEADPP